MINAQDNEAKKVYFVSPTKSEMEAKRFYRYPDLEAQDDEASLSLWDLFFSYSLFPNQRSCPKFGLASVCLKSFYDSGDLVQRSVKKLFGMFYPMMYCLWVEILEVDDCRLIIGTCSYAYKKPVGPCTKPKRRLGKGVFYARKKVPL